MRYRLTPEEKASRAARRAAVVNPYKPGDVVVCTWGYDQTNADFYWVNGATPKACRLRRLASHETEQRPLAMSGSAVPYDIFHAESDEFLARLVPPHRDGMEPGVTSKHGTAYRWDGRPVSISWYA